MLDALLGVSPLPDLELAALVGAPTFSSGEITPEDLSEVELIDYPSSPRHADGYLRGDVPMSLFEAAGSPAVSDSTAQINIGENTGSVDWPEVNHLALVDPGTDAVVAVLALGYGVTCEGGRQLRVPEGNFSFRIVVDSEVA